MLVGALHITSACIGNKLLVAFSWFFLVDLTALACFLALAICPTCMLAACEIGGSYVVCLAINSSIGDCKPLSSGMF